MNILIVGASAKIGFSIINYLSDLNNITCLGTVRNLPAFCLLDRKKINAQIIDFSKEKVDLTNIIKTKYDLIINAAYDSTHPSQMFRKNENILLNIAKPNVTTLINFSSISVYGSDLYNENNNKIKIKSDSYYSRLKIKLEKSAKRICKKSKINLINLRLGMYMVKINCGPR